MIQNMELCAIGSGEYSVVYTERTTRGDYHAYKMPEGLWGFDEVHGILREALLLRFQFGPALKGIVINDEQELMCLQMELLKPVSTTLSETSIGKLVKSLQKLHACQWIHGDIKLSNLLIGTSGATMCDFGLSSYVLHDKSVFQDSLLCTPAFRAPEFLTKDALRTPTKEMDIWALGLCVLYAITNEKFTYGAKTDAETLRAYTIHIPDTFESRENLFVRRFGDTIGNFLTYALEWNPKHRRLYWSDNSKLPETVQNELVQNEIVQKDPLRPCQLLMCAGSIVTIGKHLDVSSEDSSHFVSNVTSTHKSLSKYYAMKPIFEENVVALARVLIGAWPTMNPADLMVLASMYVLSLVRTIRFSDVQFLMRMTSATTYLEMESWMKRCLVTAILYGPQWATSLFSTLEI